MRRIGLATVCFAAIFVIGCGSSKPKDMIVGKWTPDDPKAKEMGLEFVEYKPDGVVTIKMGPASIDAKYKFTADDVIETEIEMMGKKTSSKSKVEVTKDTLTTTELDGKKEVTKFKKAAK